MVLCVGLGSSDFVGFCGALRGLVPRSGSRFKRALNPKLCVDLVMEFGGSMDERPFQCKASRRRAQDLLCVRSGERVIALTKKP